MSEEQQHQDVPFAEGEILAGKYKVERILGKGGMGVVVSAMHIALRQRVAIKFLLPGASADLVKRFMREARASAKLRSEHVARVIDVSELPTGEPYMVMEFLEGMDLSHVSRERGQLPVEDAIDYVLQACEGIGEAHMAGIVHRDLKPANLFLTTATDGTAVVKVLDFGVSKDTTETGGEEEMALTRTTAVLGSPYYMAPEQMRSSRSVDPRADIWSIGIILYQLLTRAVPFKAASFVDLALRVASEEPPPPTDHRADLPPGLTTAILRCLRRNPAERFSSVSELAAALAPFGDGAAMGSAERIARTQGAPMPTEPPPAPAAAPPVPVAALPAPVAAPPASSRTRMVVFAVLLVAAAGLFWVMRSLRGSSGSQGTMAISRSTELTSAPLAATQAPMATPAPTVEPAGSAGASPSSTASAAPTVVVNKPSSPQAIHGPASKSTAAPKAAPKCNPPFTLDANGIKHAKPECQ